MSILRAAFTAADKRDREAHDIPSAQQPREVPYDPEVAAIETLYATLAQLTREGQLRVLNYVVNRLGLGIEKDTAKEPKP